MAISSTTSRASNRKKRDKNAGFHQTQNDSAMYHRSKAHDPRKNKKTK